ncbi:unnamed protein product [Allacma fusca]|uniref:Uncharacterized protein n=1 Tax=Allacma fusca TaxID=39272 RepID=A0A8J2PQ62_9HEXA|nr:unnamed protein product [Allacma fusca]
MTLHFRSYLQLGLYTLVYLRVIMGTPGKPDDAGRSNPFAAKFAQFGKMSIQQKLKELLTKAAAQQNLGVGTKLADEVGLSQPDNKSVPGSPAESNVGEGSLTSGNKRNLNSEARGSSRSRSPVSAVKIGQLEMGDKVSSGSNEEVGKLTRPISRSISADSVSTDLSLPSGNSNREVDEGGYVVCLVVVTSLLSGEISDSKAVLFKAMQAELTLGLKTYFPLRTAGHTAREVFNKMKRLADALAPVLGMEIKESDCVKAMELLDASEADDCYDRNYLKTLREGGFMQYFCDIVTICRNFNSQ